MDNGILGYGREQLEATSAPGANAPAADEMDYQQAVRVIGEELQKTKQSFIKIGWYLKYIKDRELYGRDGYSSIYDYVSGMPLSEYIRRRKMTQAAFECKR